MKLGWDPKINSKYDVKSTVVDKDGFLYERYDFFDRGKLLFAIREFENYQGVTKCSEDLFKKVRNMFKEFVIASMDIQEEGKGQLLYLVLTDEVGNQLHLTGCTSGYSGTGPHGTFKILNEAGFGIDKRFVFSAKTFKLRHPKYDPLLID